VSELTAAGFLADLEEKPARLQALADSLADSLVDDPWHALPPDCEGVVLLGMGSSLYAGAVAAARLRSRGVAAVAELASSDLLPASSARSAVVAISASGESAETIDAVRRYRGRCPVVAMTNVRDSTLAGLADAEVAMAAGPEAGGVACRSFQHTLALLLALERRLAPSSGGPPIERRVRLAAEATADLLDRRQQWLPRVRDHLAGPDGVYVSAPARRLSSAQQSALMLREGPRIAAVACETGDWSHVDVYLTKTLEYRLLFFLGSSWDAGLLAWTTERQSTVVAVGADVAAARFSLRYRHDDNDDVRLLAEVLVAELLAQDLWARP
jgi:glucosamine--fructose-6-phosphate aminotransferase (isomerizing)